MMMTLHTANFFISTISLMMAYFITTTLSNYFKAWLALKVGDDTPEQLGFLSLNPLAHFDLIGFLLIPFFQFGWGRYVPIDPSNIRSPLRSLKTAAAFLANSFACIIIALVALVTLILIFDYNIINITRIMILYNSVSYMIVSAAYPAYSSITIACGSILIGTMYLSVLLSVLQAIVNGVSLAIFLNSHRIKQQNIDSTILICLLILFILLPLLGIFDIAGWLRVFIVQSIAYSGYAIASLLGIL